MAGTREQRHIMAYPDRGQAQLAQIKHPFVISGFRGDAIFMYVPETNFCEPQTIVESLENLYFVFADALRRDW